MFSKIINHKALHTLVKQEFASQKAPKRVAITGAAGQIGYSILFRIASGQLLGPDQPVILHLIDLPNMKNSLEGVKMELNDCAFPLLKGVVCADNLTTGFKDVDYCLLVGAKPRGPGMERADLLKDNGKIFISTGKAINDNANRNVKIVVVGNPCNTNCMICAHYAKDIPKENFTAMTKLDHNRGLFQLAEKLKCDVTDIENFSIWGNHSPSMVPMLTATKVKGKSVVSLLDKKWIDEYFAPKVGKRGAEIIAARKLSSAASAGNSAMQHIREWVLGVKGWTSFAVPSDGSYGIPKGLIFSFPVTCSGDGKWKVVKGLEITDYYRKKLEITTKELLDERKFVEEMLK